MPHNLPNQPITNQRLIGLDLARGLAVIGMVLVNFVYVFSYDLITPLDTNPSYFYSLSLMAQGIVGSILVGLAGRAVAVFLTLFGIGISLQTQRIPLDTTTNWARPFVSRYFLLLLGGLAFIPLWEADILHYIGLFGLLALPLIKLRTKYLLIIAACLLTGAKIWQITFEYSSGWQINAIGSHYEDMWTITGQLRQLFFNGYHPVFPWLSFVILGLCLGRLQLQNRTVLKRLVATGLVGALIGFSLMALGVPAEFFPADTLFVLLGMANATWLIGLCLLLSAQAPSSTQGFIITRIIRNMGRLALTHYPGHVWLGIIPVVMLRHEKMDMSFESSFGLALVYIIFTGLAGHFWLQSHHQGPLERVMRLLSSRL